MTRVFLLLLLSCTFAAAQGRFIIRVDDPDNARLLNTVNSIGNVIIVRNLNFPDQNLNALAAIVNNASFGQLRDVLDIQYQGNYLLAADPVVIPNEGSGDDVGGTFDPTPPTANPALDSLVPGRPVTAPPHGPIQGEVIVDIVGTGIDQSHPDLTDLVFETPLSVMFASGAGFLPGDIDYHNHETRLAGCIAGLNTGLLTSLGTRTGAKYRSVLCYDKPLLLTPAVPTTFTSDCIAALGEILLAHEDRLATPYLKNHAAVMCFSHSVEVPNTRVGDLDALFDLAWERGIVTSISAGNFIGTAAASSPAGAGEWVLFDDGGGLAGRRYWPPFGAATFALPGSVGFDNVSPGSDYHLKTGAHNNTPSPAPWTSSASIGSALNTANPGGFGPPMNAGVDLFAPGEGIKVPATRLHPSSGLGPIVVDDSTYYLRQGYQSGNGTSYSAAYTAAVAARILQMRPWASPAQVRAAILPPDPGPFELLTIPDLTALDPMSLSYTAWIERYRKIAGFGFFAAGLDAKTADPDHDGVTNIIEYFCGMDPRFADPQHAPQVSFDATALQLKARMQIAAYLPNPAPVTWRFQSSDDLVNWSDEGRGVITTEPQTAENGDGLDTTGTLTIDPVERRKFFRFQLTADP